jgi:hypothetical protein
MSDMSAAIGLASLSSRLAAAEQPRMIFGMNDQVTASIMPREASARLAERVRTCMVVRIRPLTAARWGQAARTDLVNAMDAHDLFDQIGLAVDIGTPGGNGDLDRLAGARHLEAEAARISGTRRRRRSGRSAA